MGFFRFLRGQLSEQDGTPSNNRVIIFCFMTTVMLLILGVVFGPIWNYDLELPEIPPSFETFVEWVCGIFVLGSATGKGIQAFKERGKSGNANPDGNQQDT